MPGETIKTVAKILTPIIIGVVIFVWLFSDEFSLDILRLIKLDFRFVAMVFLSLVFVVGRDLGLCWRFVALTNRTLSWRKALKVTMLCEFTSTITPTSVGGGALSMIFLNREGINWGRATTITVTTLFLDELFFVISCPIVVACIPWSELFGFAGEGFMSNLKLIFWVVYFAIVVWTLILFWGIIVKPQAVNTFVKKIFSIRLLKRWYSSAVVMADNILVASREIKSMAYKWWINVFAATSVSWLSRYLLVNALFWGLYPSADQLLIFARQFIVWTILMVSPTPGGSGVSEYLFNEYYGDLISGGAMLLILALLWRVLSYYIYLVIGIFMMPSFLAAKKIENNKLYN